MTEAERRSSGTVRCTATLVACGGSDGDGDKAGPTKNTGSSGAAEPGGERTPDAMASSAGGRPVAGSAPSETINKQNDVAQKCPALLLHPTRGAAHHPLSPSTEEVP